MKKDSENQGRENENTKNEADVVDFAQFRKKRAVKEELSPDRDPLYVSHLRGKMAGSPHMRRPEADDFGDRLTRIRSSLEKINRLMGELKKMSNDASEDRRGQSRK